MPTATVKKSPSLRDLKAARSLTERALAYFENVGYDIGQFVEDADLEHDFALGKKGKLNLGPACFIGSFRLAAGVIPDPEEDPEADEPGDGDGPELRLALQIADGVAQRVVGASPKIRAEIENAKEREGAGSLIEALGFVYHKEYDEALEALNDSFDWGGVTSVEKYEAEKDKLKAQYSPAETDKACEMMRRVLRDIAKQITAKEAQS